MTVSPLDRKVVALLVGGFTLVILLMLATGRQGLGALQELGQGSAGLLTEERESGRALASAQELETEFDQIFYAVPGVRQAVAGDALESRLLALEAALTRTRADGRAAPEMGNNPRWREYQEAGLAFGQAVRGATAAPPTENAVEDVRAAHQRVLEAVHALVVDNDRRNEEFVDLDRRALEGAVRASIRLLAITGGIAVVVAVLTVLLVQRLLQRLSWQRVELERLSLGVLQTQETTLRQVAHDLHDQIGQTLTALEANLGALESVSKERTVKGRVEDCIGLVQDLMSETRTLSQLLRPSILDDFGLAVSLESLTESFAQRTGTAVRFTSTCSGRLHEDMETHLYRIAQEALTNVARHSGATTVDLMLKESGPFVELIIEDNGRGMVKTTPDSLGGVGLHSMQARAREIGGSIEIINRRESCGVRILVRAPIVRVERYESQDAIAVS